MPIDKQPTSSSTTINTTAATTTVEPRRKRAKIISACGECRRKKTKCNGENPCRNCEKSGVACVYPSSSSNDDKRNAPSKAALEAIEERLKTIEDMLRAIIKAQNIFSGEMDPVVSNFLQRGESNSPPPPAPHMPYNNQPQPLTPQSTTSQQMMSNSPPLQPSSPLQNRLPSIRTLSTSSYPEPKMEHRDLPPLGFHNYAYPPPPHSTQQCKYQENDEKKR